MSVTNTAANVTSSVPAFRAVSGQTLGFLALLVALAGLGVSASQGSGRILVRDHRAARRRGLAGGRPPRDLLALDDRPAVRHDPDDVQARAHVRQNSINETVKAGFADGTLTASVGFGADPRRDRRGAGVLGAIFGFRKKQPPVD